MPGRIVMPAMEHLSNGVGHEHSAPSLFSNPRSDSVQTVQKSGFNRLVNGDHGQVKPEPGMEMAQVNGVSETPPSLNLPPEIVDIIEQSLVPLKTLLGRVSQECFNELDELITRLEDVNTQPAVNGINGASSTSLASQATVHSATKKRMILEFANKHRERFIKLLVVLNWSRKADDVKQLVYLKMWFDRLGSNYLGASDALGMLKRDLHYFKQPNPDIRTALEALSSGTASWIQDLGYIPPKPLTPEQMLQTLRNINALLSIRINLHEELPRPLKQWNVANGRATFRIPNEFEFDVMIVDEDPAARFYFLDVRFLFSPTSEIPTSQVRQALEDKANELLGTGGLNNCYEYLHDFILTYKINVLQKQAQEMVRSVWFNSLRIEKVRRTLIVQYWTASKRGKSWIEIGIASGKSKTGKESWRGKPPPRLTLRWFRNSVQVTDHNIQFDWADLSISRILKQIIASHTISILEAVRIGLPAAPGGLGLQTLEASVSAAEPADCSLKMQIYGQRAPVLLTMETISGRMILQPPSPLSVRVQTELNDQLSDAQLSPLVARYLAREMQQQTERQAEHCGWKILKNFRTDSAIAAFKQDIISASFFRVHTWGSTPWAIAATISLSGEAWWIIELGRPSATGPRYLAEPIDPLSHRRAQDPYSLEPLRRIESLAVAAISIFTSKQDLGARKVPYDLHHERLSSEAGGDNGSPASPAHSKYMLLINTNKILSSVQPKPTDFASSLLRLEIYNYSPRTNYVTYLVRGLLKKSKHLAETITGIQDDDVQVKGNGQFALKLHTLFGKSCSDVLVTRLISLHRARSCAAALQKNNLQLDTLTLAKVAFTYPALSSLSIDVSPDPLTAEISFDGSSNTHNPISIKFPPTNPHRRIQALLTSMLNNPSRGNRRRNMSFEFFFPFLRVTLPLVGAVDAIEDRDLSTNFTEVYFHPRSGAHYRLVYKQKGIMLDIRLKRIRDEYSWVVEEAPVREGRAPSPPMQKNPEAVEAIKKVLSDRGGGWRGLGSCIKANIFGGLEDALLKIDDAVRSASSAEGSGTTQKTGANAGAPVKVKPEVITLE